MLEHITYQMTTMSKKEMDAKLAGRIALLKVHQVYEVAGPKNIPIIGQGGIVTAKDAIEFMIAGAATVGVGTALFYDPMACVKINEGIIDYLAEHEMRSVSELVGSLEF